MPDQIEWLTVRRKISELIPAEYNPRKLSVIQEKELKKSVEKFNLADPLILNLNNRLIGGHQRLKILAQLGINEIDVRIPNRQLSMEEEKELNLRLNRNTGEWDFDLLANFSEELLKDVGFDSKELDKIFKSLTEEDIETDALQISVETDIARGDTYKLGRHRLMCGDETNADDVDRLLRGIKPVLMVTDPPYGVEYDPSWREGFDLGVGERSTGKVANDDIVDWRATWNLIDPQVLYLFHAGKYSAQVAQSLIESGYDIVSQIIWAKQHFVLSRGDYHWQHEPCWYAVKKGMPHNWQGLRDQTTLWSVVNNNAFGNSAREETWGHGTQKPVELMTIPILNNSQRGDMVCDMFLGSGTTLIACQQNNRICYGMEIEPKYCQVIINRWEKLTGQKAVKDDGGG